MELREPREEDIDAACALLEAAFRRPEEARLFRALVDSDDLALALVAIGSPAGGELDPEGGADPEGPVASPPPLGSEWVDDAETGVSGNAPAEPEGEASITGVAVLSHLASPKGAVGLGPLAVAPDQSDRGIGKALIAECVERARRAGYSAIFVLGQSPYYTRFGFSVEAAGPFRSEYPAEFLMALELEKDALEGGGELRYAPAFAGL